MVDQYEVGDAGFVKEVTSNVREVPTEFRRFGNAVKINFPYEEPNFIAKMASSQFMPYLLAIQDKSVTLRVTMQVVDPLILCYMTALSAVSDGTVIDTSYYNHAWAPLTKDVAFETQPFTVHCDFYTSTAKSAIANSMDVIGCHITRLRLYDAVDSGKGLYLDIDILGQRITDKNATTNLLGETSGANADAEGVTGANVANRITNASRGPIPANPIDDAGIDYKFRTNYENNPQGYFFKQSVANSLNIGGTITFTSINSSGYGEISAGTGTDLSSKYAGFEWTISFDVSKDPIKRPGFTNYGVDISEYPQYILVKQISNRSLKIILNDDSVSYNATILPTLQGTDSNAIYLKFVKANDSSNFLALCFAPTSGTVQNKLKSNNAVLPVTVQTNYFEQVWDFKDINFVAKDKESAMVW